MRKRNLKLIFLVIVGLVFLAMGTLQAVDVPDEVKIYEDSIKDHKKGPVNLAHKKHSADYKVACTECHHAYKDGKNVWKEGDPVQKCSACHDPEQKKDNVDKLQNAFHKNCQGCHKELKGKQAPYKKCNDCHEKKG
jgi:hypothetical protein